MSFSRAVTSECQYEVDAMRTTCGSHCSSIPTFETGWWRSGNERIRTTRSTHSGSAVCRPAPVRRPSGRGSSKQPTTTTWRRCWQHTAGEDTRQTRRTCTSQAWSSSVERKSRQPVVRSLTPPAGRTYGAGYCGWCTLTIDVADYFQFTERASQWLITWAPALLCEAAIVSSTSVCVSVPVTQHSVSLRTKKL